MRRLFLLLTLTGCAVVQPLVNPVDGILAEAVTAARAPAPEQAAALARAQQAGVASPADRLRLATLLATLPPPLRDDARAAELLEPIADAASPGIGRVAALLAAQVVERQRPLREIERLKSKADRAARERAGADKERDKREEALKQQLEALRAIERGILEREENLRRRQK
ncbi:MAG TPA: hypothetical protein VGX52_09395 [Burkholderiales bacterium]|nr:hypothetical protein [Burkholderiales bacterium]